MAMNLTNRILIQCINIWVLSLLDHINSLQTNDVNVPFDWNAIKYTKISMIVTIVTIT
jgi:hypothetical protein